MTDQEKKKLLDDYFNDVVWLRNHVPRDDIYEFAQQLLMSSEFLLAYLMKKVDLVAEASNDKMLASYVRNLVAIRAMKSTDFDGTINTEVNVMET